MFKSIFTITLRSLSRQGVFSIINIFGLSIGLAVVMLISLLNFYELSFDRGFKESKSIYRVNACMTKITPGETSVSTPNALAPAMTAAIPEVIAAVRVCGTWANFTQNEHPVDIEIKWADDDFFRLFDTPFIYGVPEDVMSRPNVIALSEELAKTIFGNKNPLGELLTHSVWSHPPLEVVAVFKDYPVNSSFREFKAVAPLKHHYNTWLHSRLNWGNNFPFETFCLLVANADTAAVNAKMLQTISDATQGEWEERGYFNPKLQRLTDIHLHSTKFIGTSLMKSLGDSEKVKTLTLMSVIILLIACVNYMNLSTVRAQKRSREIGISKTVGAKRRELIARLTLETAIFTFISFIVAFMFAWALLPTFNNLTGEQLEIGLALQPMFLCIVLLIWLVTTFLAAAYPALYMSGFPPLTAIRSQFMPNSSHATVRKILTVGQFAVAIVLIAWALIIQAQITFMNDKDLGYNPRNLIGLWCPHTGDLNAVINDFKAQSSVEIAAFGNANFFRAGGARESMLMKNADDQTGFPIRIISTSHSFIDLMQIKLIAGKHFPERQPNDTTFQIILNRAAVDYLEMTPEEAIGKRLPQFGQNIEIYGVVENFHFESLHRPIGGFVIMNFRGTFLMLRVVEGNLSEQRKIYEEIYKRHFPDMNFVPHFLDQYVAKYYDGERRTSRIAVVFSILAIFVACMGVFGLTAFMAEQRTKEIGIRKVMGATIWDIVRLFTGDYVKLLCVSLVIAIPAAWWVGERYLQNFAYRISLSWWIFAAAALITVALTLLTVSVLAIRSAMKNPVDSIKTE